jgi:PAT family beta-lactamase induction signal transducer AmpG
VSEKTESPEAPASGVNGDIRTEIDVRVRRPWTPFYGFMYLPVGISQGFVTVTLAYVLRQSGVSVAAIAGLISLTILPWTWKVLGGPMLDLALTPRTWNLLFGLIGAATLSVLGARAEMSTSLPLLSALTLLSGIFSVLSAASVNNIIGAVEPENERGAIGGYVQAGTLGGAGLGGGAGLWLAQHGGGTGPASAVLAVVCLLCLLPLLTIRAPYRARPDAVRVRTVQLARTVWSMARSRRGALALLINVLPMGLGASNQLWSAVAGDWSASANVVALVTGVLGGLVSIPGSLFGGLLCRRFHIRGVYLGASVACALLLVGMAVAPRTPVNFVIFTLTSAFTLGATWGALSSVTFACIGCEGAATKAALLGSFANIPLAACVPLVGWAQSHFGSKVMLLTEAGLAVTSLIVYAVVTRATDPGHLSPTTLPICQPILADSHHVKVS